MSEAVEVKGASPVIDTSSTTVGATLDSELLSQVPVGRRFSDALYLAPGVSSGGQVGHANPSIAGGSGLENSYVVDGVNITNGGYGALGSYSIVFGSLGNGLPFDFIKEAQVKTGGYQAEYGQASGGVVNVVTKSGSNQLRGSLFGYIRPDGLESTYDQVQTTNGTVNITGTREDDFGAEIGGPIVPGKAFFFGAIDPQSTRTLYVAPDGFPLQSLGAFPRIGAPRRMPRKRRGRRPRRSASTRRSSAIRRTATTARSAISRCSTPTPRRSAASTSTAATTRRSSTKARLASAGCSRARSRALRTISSRCPRWTSGRSPTTQSSRISRRAVSVSTRSAIRARTGSTAPR